MPINQRFFMKGAQGSTFSAYRKYGFRRFESKESIHSLSCRFLQRMQFVYEILEIQGRTLENQTKILKIECPSLANQTEIVKIHGPTLENQTKTLKSKAQALENHIEILKIQGRAIENQSKIIAKQGPIH